ncbi:MAG TPA: glycoside hydrolase, partial [Elusimicrobiota bacterium]|nr:glycoside hydrolase [Elusimicrobiota bacterium]
MKRCACVHGHFYQPPRENPWTGTVERQPSAGQDHDWNARVARECYIPNGEARVLDGQGRIADLVDNYEWMSFDFGPTLLAWLETAHPHAHARLLEADRRSAERLNGHGNAMAQSFHHTILPLAHPRDRVTEIRWGLADFEHRFKRKAEGLWLPECAADDATLAALAVEGVKFVLLEPHQAEVVPAAPVKGGAEKPADAAAATPVPGAPYRWRGAGGAELALFFYDGGLSRSVAFEHAMRDSRAFARRISALIPPTAEDALSIVATDGESYGHHDAFAEMGLAHLLRYALPEAGLEPVNLAWYLARNRPRREVKLKAGATS